MKLLPQSLKLFKMNSVFIRLLLSFTSFILISVMIVGVTSYISSSRRLLEEVKKSNFLILQKSRDSIDKEISRINDISVKIAIDKRVSMASFLYSKDHVSDMNVFSEISGYLNLLKSTSNIYSNIWIRFNKLNSIVNFENKYEEDSFFNDVCVYKANLKWDELSKEYYAFSSIGRQEIYFNYASNPVITFIRSIPIGEIKPLGIVAINMDEKVLGSAININSKSNPVITYIVDSKKNTIFCNDSQYKYEVEDKYLKGIQDLYYPNASDKEGEANRVINGRKYIIEYISSNVNDWRYITLIPTYLITSKVNNIRNITITIMVLSIFIGLIFSYILVKRVYNPINNIVSFLNIINNNKKLEKDQSKRSDEFGFINNIINYVYNENESLKESFNKNLPMLKDKVLNDLVDGKVADLKFKEIIENIGLQLPFNIFQVIVFEIDEYGSLDKNIQIKLESEVIALFESNASEVFIHNVRVNSIKKGKDKIILILNDEGHSQDTGVTHEFLHQISNYFNQHFGITFTIGIGKAYEGYENCSMSFIEALFALKYKVVKGQNTIIHIDEVSTIPLNIFEYPIETEKHMVNKLKSGDMASIKTSLEEIFARNLNNQNASPEMINNFFNALIGTLVRTIYEIQFTVGDIFEAEYDLYNEINTKNTLMEKKNYILFLFKSVTDFVNNRKSNHNLKVYEKVIKYIERNFQKELSLDNVSDFVGLSPSYLSLVFKEVSGMNFVEYVNTYRINRAKIMLGDIDITLTVSEISEKVGYNNSNTFIKVFKKYEGVTPGQFRKTDKT